MFIRDDSNIDIESKLYDTKEIQEHISYIEAQGRSSGVEML